MSHWPTKWEREHPFINPRTHYIETHDSLPDLTAEWKGEKGCSLQWLGKLCAPGSETNPYGENWVFLRKEWEEEQERVSREASLKAIIKARKEHASIVKFTLFRLLDALGYPKPGEDAQKALERVKFKYKSSTEVVRCINDFIKLQRLLLGDTESREEHNVVVTFKDIEADHGSASNKKVP